MLFINGKPYADNYYVRRDILRDLFDWTCQQCGRKHGQLREKKKGKGYCKVRVQVHHPDRDTENPDARLILLCDLCHITSRDDIPERDKNAKRTRNLKKKKAREKSGQLDLFDEHGYFIMQVNAPILQLIEEQ